VTDQKRCRRCSRDLPAAAFRENGRLRGGLDSWCVVCHVTATREWRSTHRDTITARRRELWAARADEINADRRRKYAAARGVTT
jgi:hypothetical protein